MKRATNLEASSPLFSPPNGVREGKPWLARCFVERAAFSCPARRANPNKDMAWNGLEWPDSAGVGSPSFSFSWESHPPASQKCGTQRPR